VCTDAVFLHDGEMLGGGCDGAAIIIISPSTLLLAVLSLEVCAVVRAVFRCVALALAVPVLRVDWAL
jgi:hypothetical protein